MLLQRLLCSLPQHKRVEAPIRACVAVVLRLAAGTGIPHGRFATLEQMKSWMDKLESGPEIEVLFIRRAVNPRDRWSGHIGCPGGRALPDESPLDTARRECLEETGVDLANEQRFALVGKLDDRLVMSRKRMAVSTFVFAQLDAEPTVFKLQASEVADAFWCNVRLWTGSESRIQEYAVPLDHLKMPKALRAFASMVGLTRGYFPCIYLRPDHDDRHAYALWGMTFGIISDLLSAANLPSLRDRKAAELKLGVFGRRMPFRTDSRLVDSLIFVWYNASIKVCAAVVAALAAAVSARCVISRL